MTLRILCFGASITAGWSAGGSHHYPYASQLSARLADGIPTTHFNIEVDGLPGDTVMNGKYNERMYEDLMNVKHAYDWVIIQAGGNDLARNHSAAAVFSALITFWQMPIHTGANMLALTVTERGNDNAEQAAEKEKLNHMISTYQQTNFTFADPATAIPYNTMSVADRKLYWSDDTHFTEEGYRRMGDVIADRLIDIMDAHRITAAKL